MRQIMQEKRLAGVCRIATCGVIFIFIFPAGVTIFIIPYISYYYSLQILSAYFVSTLLGIYQVLFLKANSLLY